MGQFTPFDLLVVMLLIDFIQPLDFPEANELAGPALQAAKSARQLARAQGVPVICANDKSAAGAPTSPPW